MNTSPASEEEIIKYYATAGYFLMFSFYEEEDCIFWEVEILVDPAVSVPNQEYKDKKIK